jgi:PAS domain S-box-containing protein
MRPLLNSHKDALISLTLDGVIRSWNPEAEHLFGYSASEAIGKPIAFLCDIDRIEEQNALIEQAKAGKVAGPVGTVRLRQSGGNVEIELAVMPIRGADGAFTALALSARDIAERKEADRHRTLLLRELSHRVKNALATVQAIATQTLKEATAPDAFVASFSAWRWPKPTNS